MIHAFDRVGTRVTSAGADAHVVAAGALQPDAPRAWRLVLRNADGRLLQGHRLCVADPDGVLVERGPAPSLRDASWHPDVPDHLAELVARARIVVAAIPHCDGVECAPVVRSDDRSQVGGMATFRERGRDGRGHGTVPDHALDAVPGVRAVERMAASFAAWLAVRTHDDGSGVDGDLAIVVSAERLCLLFDDEDGCLLALRSDRRHGTWTHSTNVTIPGDGDADPVRTLRALADPTTHVREIAADDHHWGPILKRDVVCEDAEAVDDSIVVRVRPGTMLRERTT